MKNNTMCAYSARQEKTVVQVYFLVVLCNLIMGIILTKEFFNKRFENFSLIYQLLSSEILQVTIGCVGTIIGILTLFLRYTGNMLILGDFIPAIIAIISGITLFIEYIANEEKTDSSIVKFIENTFLKNRIILGFAALTVGIIHFIIPSIELL